MILSDTMLRALQDDRGMVDYLKVALLDFIREIQVDEDPPEAVVRAQNLLIDAVENVIEAREIAIQEHDEFTDMMISFMEEGYDQENIVEFIRPRGEDDKLC